MEERKISPAIIIGIGAGIGIAAAIGIYALARAGKVFAQSVYDEVGVELWGGAHEDPIIQEFLAIEPLYDGTGLYALGEPDGFPAVLRGYEGNYLTLLLSDPAEYVGTLKLHLMNLYDRIVDSTYVVEVSADGISWVEVYNPRILIDVGTSIYEIPINQSIAFVRIRQRTWGVNQGIDAIEALR